MRSLVAGCLLWAAFPPLNIWPLAAVGVAIQIAWIVPATRLTRGQYFFIWVGASLSWLGLLQGIRLAFWPLYAGWIALSLYLAVYSIGFVGLSRVLVHRWRWPLVIAAPLAWISLELVRGYMITGFSSCLLGHVVAKHPLLIQVACHLGTYGVSLGIVLSAIVFYFLYDHGRWLFKDKSLDKSAGSPALYWRHWIQLSIALLSIGLWIAFGYWELARGKRITDERESLFTAALIQENAPTIFDMDIERNARRGFESWEDYLSVARDAASATPNLDLIVWPESTFTRNEPVFEWDGSQKLPVELEEENVVYEQWKEVVESYRLAFDDKIAQLTEATQRPEGSNHHPYYLLGNDLISIREGKYDRYNAALWVTADGKMVDYYAKQHLVMFGEYVPFADFFPILSRIPGLPRMSSGKRAVSLDLNGKAILVPSICFENVLPHLIHQQIRALEIRSESPDVIVNITNDGWFRGSSILDHHLANATLACVENRRPMLVAANTGLSAWIDGSGDRKAVSSRMKADFIISKPIRDGRWGLWQTLGDWPVRLAAIVCLGAYVVSRLAEGVTGRM